MAVTGWFPVPPAYGVSMENLLSKGMEKVGLAEEAAHCQGSNIGSARKPLVRFIVNPGNEDVRAGFAGFTPGANTKSITTIAVKSKPIHSRQQGVTSGASLKGIHGTGKGDSGSMVNKSNPVVFGAGNQLQDQEVGGMGSTSIGGSRNHIMQFDIVDALHLTVVHSKGNSQGVGFGDELGKIILAATGQGASQVNNMVIDPLQEYYNYDAEDEGLDQEQYLDMDSVESSEVSFTTKLDTLNNSVIYLEDQPSEGAPLAVIKRKRPREVEGTNDIMLANRFEVLKEGALSDHLKSRL